MADDGDRSGQAGPRQAGPRSAGPRSADDSRAPRIDDFLGHPTRDLEDWRWLWDGDVAFPIRSHRGLFGPLIVFFKKLLRPLVAAPQNDLWERQRVWNLIVLEHLDRLEKLRDQMDRRLGYLEEFMKPGLEEVMRHNDALFSRVDQKLDRYRREARELLVTLGDAVALARGGEAPPSTLEPLAAAHADYRYLDFENRFRGDEEEVRGHLAPYLERLDGASPVLDLGCGRGEALEALAAHGLEVRGVDANGQMVAHCRERGLDAVEGDLIEHLAGVDAGSLGAVVSFHVVEHLPPAAVDRLVRLAHRALRPGGVLVIETPNPLSVVVAARNFWLDPTHRRPLHPDYLVTLAEQTGFESVERLDRSPFPVPERLPELSVDGLPDELAHLADGVNRLRDRLDDLLFGHQDYALVAIRGE